MSTKIEELHEKLNMKNISVEQFKEIVADVIQEMKLPGGLFHDCGEYDKIDVVSGPEGEPVVVISGATESDPEPGSTSGMPVPIFIDNKVVRDEDDEDIEYRDVVHSDFVEIAPGIKVAKHVINSVTKGSTNQEELQIELAELREDKSMQRSSALRKRAKQFGEEVRKDLKIARKITDSLVNAKFIEESQKKAAADLLGKAVERELDSHIQFVDVTQLDPKAACSRVLNLKADKPDCDVEPVDLTDVYNDVELHGENLFDKLTSFMRASKYQDVEKLPDRIRIAIPNRDVPVSWENQDVSYELCTYVNMAALPLELQSIVRAVIALRGGKYIIDGEPVENSELDFSHLCELIDALKKRAEEASEKIESDKLSDQHSYWARLAGL